MAPGTQTLIVVAGMFLVALGLVAYGLAKVIAPGDPTLERVNTYALVPQSPSRRGQARGRSRLATFRIQLNMMLSSLNSEKIAMNLLRADWRVTVTEFILIRFFLTLASFLVASLISGSILPGAGLAMIVYLVPGIYMRRKISKRRLKFDKQLLDVLVLINGAVRSGFSLLQSVELVMHEMKPPASIEFKRAVHEAGLGIPLPQALGNLATRMRNADLDLVVTAIDIQYQVGGNLATMLSAVSETIRERIRLFGEVRVITTQQRFTGYLLSVLPFFIGGMLFMMNPEYMSGLFAPGAMLCIPIGALIGIILGHFAIQRIAKIDI